MKKIHVLLIVLFAFGLTNCSSKPKKEEREEQKIEEVKKEETAKTIEKEESGRAESEQDLVVDDSQIILEEPEIFVEENVVSNNQSVIVSGASGSEYIVLDENQNIPFAEYQVSEGEIYNNSEAIEPEVVTSSTTLISEVPSQAIVTEKVVLQAPASEVVELSDGIREDEAGYQIIDLEINQPEISGERTASFKNGMKSFSRDCNMRRSATTNSDIVGQISSGKRLWVDNYSDRWAKVYRKSGPAYVSKVCL